AKLRPGTEFHQYAARGFESARLFPFLFSDEQAYWIEIDLDTLRIHRFAGTLLDDDYDANITEANTGGYPNQIKIESNAYFTNEDRFAYIDCPDIPRLHGRWYELRYAGIIGLDTYYDVYVDGHPVDMTGW